MKIPRFVGIPEFQAGAVSGLLLTLSLPPSPLGFLSYFAFTPVLALMFSPERHREAVRLRVWVLALTLGFAHWLTQLHWLVLLGEASPLTFRWALPFMLLLLAAYMTLPYAAVLWILAWLRRVRGPQAIWWFPGLWVAMEWATALGDMGFPWLRLATSQLRYIPVLQLAGLLGELGISLFVACVNVLLVVAWQAWRRGFPALGTAFLFRWWAPVAIVLLFSATLAYGVRTMRDLETPDAATNSLDVGVVQANVDLMDKWDPSKRDSTFVPYIRLTGKVAVEGARLVIWPETAVPLDLPSKPAYLELVRDLVRSTSTHLLTGFPERAVTEEGLLEGYNSSLLMDDAGLIRARYRKLHLLPFGERIPFQGLLPVLGRIDFGQAEWTPGPEQTIFEMDGHRFANLICFESIFPDLSRSAVMRGAGFLVNMTNDGWFGDTLLPYQHAWMAVMRAAENRVPLLRCANNGLSFAVLPSGRVEEMTRLFERTSFVVSIQPRPGGSFYTRYGDATVFLLVALGFVFLLLVGRRRRRPTVSAR